MGGMGTPGVHGIGAVPGMSGMAGAGVGMGMSGMGAQLAGNGLGMGPVHPFLQATQRQQQMPPKVTLYVEGVPTDATEREVYHLFRPFPGLISLRLRAAANRMVCRRAQQLLATTPSSGNPS